jgi:acetyl esterase/lipase
MNSTLRNPGIHSKVPFNSFCIFKSFALISLILVLSFCYSLSARPDSLPPLVLWPKGAPDARGHGEPDTPTLTAFLPEPGKACGTAIVICPGGSYGGLADYEGAAHAQWLAKNGIAGLVLKYRLGSSGYRHPAMLHDAARALRLARAKAKEWNYDPTRVGIMGSSAGGHLAATLLTHFDAGDAGDADPVERQSSRPNFGILCYPVITMGDKSHSQSRENLLGKNPSPELIDLLSNEKHVTRDTPPCFIWTTGEDKTVPVENSLDFASALLKAGVPFDLHIYQKGPHGGPVQAAKAMSGTSSNYLHPWATDLLFWLRQNDLLR